MKKVEFKDLFNLYLTILLFIGRRGLIIFCNIIFYILLRNSNLKLNMDKVNPCTKEADLLSQRPIWSTVLRRAGLYSETLSQNEQTAKRKILSLHEVSKTMEYFYIPVRLK